MRVSVLGSSHIFALAQGRLGSSPHEWSFKNLGDFCPGSRIVLPIDGGMDEGHLRPDLEAWIASQPPSDILFLTISGSDWLSLCVSNRDEPFDFILPSRPDLPEIEGSRLIPFAEMRELMRRQIRHILLGVGMIAARTRSRVIYLEPPPPIEDNEHISRTATWEQDAIAQRGVTSPWLRLKLYLLHSELISEACAAANVFFHRVPSDAKTEHGFMPVEGVGDDPMHATGRWAAHVMADLDRTYV